MPTGARAAGEKGKWTSHCSPRYCVVEQDAPKMGIHATKPSQETCLLRN